MHLTELSELLAVQPPSYLECCSMEMHRCYLCTGHPATKSKNTVKTITQTARNLELLPTENIIGEFLTLLVPGCMGQLC